VVLIVLDGLFVALEQFGMPSPEAYNHVVDLCSIIANLGAPFAVLVSMQSHLNIQTQ
jgi:hypothetical protein